MSYDALTTYLADHLTGATAAVELLDRLTTLSRDTHNEDVFSSLRAEAEDDRQLLRRIVDAVGGDTERRGWSAVAWYTERLAAVELRVDDPAGLLQVFEAVEVLELGVEAKQALWRALAAAAEGAPPLRDMDFVELERRARDQQGRLERLRLDLAPQVLTGLVPGRQDGSTAP